ncbi:VacJ family lipoprotein [Desulfurivibrio sp. D14AmB]|uniref:MlaA family lipoprotein n=1 Tax=Desulfurivibrio sp. D14AmB TaxID=3374370 RepID=UPI00376EEE61
MKRRLYLLLGCWLIGASLGSPAAVVAAGPEPLVEEDWADDPWADDPWVDGSGGTKTLADPLEPLNRVSFVINDRLYFWVLKPVATGYANTVPQEIRICIGSFFRNLRAPVRVVNHFLQGRFKASGTELVRFTINTTVGIGGLVDSASRNFGIKPSEADLGQTLGVYGLGGGFYLYWPMFGPSSLRDTAGMVGDSYLNPLPYLIVSDSELGVGAYSLSTVNAVSFRLGEYERLVESSLDPYLAVRDGYWQYRSNQVRERRRQRIENIGPPAIWPFNR